MDTKKKKKRKSNNSNASNAIDMMIYTKYENNIRSQTPAYYVIVVSKKKKKENAILVNLERTWKQLLTTVVCMLD